MVRAVWREKPKVPKQVGPHEWLIERPSCHWFKQMFDVKFDSAAEVYSSIARWELEVFEDYVKAFKSEGSPEIDPKMMELVEFAVKRVGDKILVMGMLMVAFQSKALGFTSS